MTIKQTCCPFCHSAFYVTSLQLNAYKGQARCGQCHQIFDAMANLIVKNSATSPITLNQFEQDAENAEHAPSIENDLQSETKTVILSQNFKDKKSNTAISDAPAKEEELLFSDDQGIHDEDEDQQTNTPVKNSTTASSVLLSDVFDQQFLDDTLEKKAILEKQNTDVEKLHHAADDSWIEDLLKEEDQTQNTVKSPVNEPKSPAVKSPAPLLAESFTEPKRPNFITDHEEDLLSYLNRTGVTRSNVSSSANMSIAEQKPASHRILQPTTKAYQPSYLFGWMAMSVLMLLLLIAQFVYFNFESLSINPKTANKIEKMCAIFQCKIPYMNATELQIKNIKLNSNTRGQTTFSGKLINSATLSQPFPALKLTLKRKNQVIASQIIQPRQYLPENLKTLSRLATKTPYPIEFTIKKSRSDIADFVLEPSYK